MFSFFRSPLCIRYDWVLTLLTYQPSIDFSSFSSVLFIVLCFSTSVIAITSWLFDWLLWLVCIRASKNICRFLDRFWFEIIIFYYIIRVMKHLFPLAFFLPSTPFIPSIFERFCSFFIAFVRNCRDRERARNAHTIAHEHLQEESITRDRKTKWYKNRLQQQKQQRTKNTQHKTKKSEAKQPICRKKKTRREIERERERKCSEWERENNDNERIHVLQWFYACVCIINTMAQHFNFSRFFFSHFPSVLFAQTRSQSYPSVIWCCFNY